MQVIGFLLLGLVLWIGFQTRETAQVSPFDAHALTMVLLGSTAAVLVSSTRTTALRTITCLRELVPRFRVYAKDTSAMEQERDTLCALWREGKRSMALDLADKSRFSSIKKMVTLLLNRSPAEVSAMVFLELRHDEIRHWQPAVNNWEMLSKLGPSFGMVATISGMIQMFSKMSADNMNIGSSMSLALVATLYGVAFGAGVAGPIGHFLNGQLDERLGLLDRCEKSVNELVVRAAA